MGISSKKLWDFCSFSYNNSIKFSLAHQDQFEDVIRKIDFDEGLLLDTGCGTGDFEIALLKNKEKIKIVSCDFSAKMLENARKRLGKYSANVCFYLVDLNDNLPFKDNHFDAMVAINVLFAIKSTKNYLLEAHRLLKDGGLIIIANPKKDANMGRTIIYYYNKLREQEKKWERFILLLRALYFFPFALVVLGLNLIMVAWGKSKKYTFYTKEEFQRQLEETGFKKIDFQETLANQDWLISARKVTDPSIQTR
jgi:ubiquinone/menaquinone biosynthesis C-methylase UbiE